jgi:hypothetical protein
VGDWNDKKSSPLHIHHKKWDFSILPLGKKGKYN